MTIKPIRLIATDVDGTLLNDGGVIPERNLRAIQAAQEKGITVAISSGRFPENVYLLLEDYQLRLPIIGANGGRITDENLRTLSEHEMPSPTAREVLELLIDVKADFFIFGHRALCVSRKDGVHHSELSQGERVTRLGFSYYRGIEEARAFVNRSVYKFFICNNVPLAPLRETLKTIKGIEITQSNERNIEVMPAGINKAMGVRELAGILGVPMDRVMTLGDESNDVPMLRCAGFGVAMGNGSEEAKAAARYVTADNNQCGFAQAVEKYALES